MKKTIIGLATVLAMLTLTGCSGKPRPPYVSPTPITSKVLLTKFGSFTSDDPFYINGKRIYKGYFAEDNLTITHRGKVTVTRDGTSETVYPIEGDSVWIFYSALTFMVKPLYDDTKEK